MHQLFNNQVPLIIGTNKNEGLLIKVNHHPLHLIFVLTILTKLLTILFVLVIYQNYFNAAFHESMFQGFFQRDGGDKSEKANY